MTILLFLAVLFVLILVHEWGHFITAKKTGMRVDEFGIGFPPKLWGVKKGETEYTINALPIGGFVKIFGEDSLGAGESSDSQRSFIAKPKWAQALVLVAGVVMNILFAWFLFTLVYAIGVPTAIEESAASPEAKLVVSNVLPDSPAAEGGLPVGTEIVGLSAGVDRDQLLTPSSFKAFIEDHTDIPITVTYLTGAEEYTTEITPQVNVLSDTPSVPAVGVALVLLETVRSPLHVAVYDGFLSTIYGVRDVTVGLSSLLYDSVRGQADFSQIAGPVGIAGLVGDAAGYGFTSLMLFTAFISLNLAVINLLPFPALDGGRLVMVAVEAVTRRPINPLWVMRVNTVGFALLLILMLVVTYGDISRLL